MTTTVGQQLVPHQPPSVPALWAADQGVASSLESVLSDNTHRVYGTQWRIFTGWCDEVGLAVSAGRAPHRGSLPGRPRQLRRQHRHHPAGHVRHRQGPRVGEAGIALPGPGRARLFERMGTETFPAPAPVRRPHRRRARRDSPHRCSASKARPRHRDGSAGC